MSYEHCGGFPSSDNKPTSTNIRKYKSAQLIKGAMYQIYEDAVCPLSTGLVPITPRIIATGMYMKTEESLLFSSFIFLVTEEMRYTSATHYFLKAPVHEAEKDSV